MTPALHWLSIEQLVRQAPSSQVEGLHSSGRPTMQVPSPSQELGGMNLSLPSHEPSLQVVPALYLAQPPWPLQKPLWPQVSGPSSRHMPWGSLSPAGTGAHSPIMSG